MQHISVLFSVFIMTSVSLAAGQNFQCPRTISVSETVRGIPEGWHVAHDNGPTRLFDVSMAYADGSTTMSDYEKKLSKRRTEYTWDLNAVVNREQWFVRCEYERTNILILIPVPEKIKICSTTQVDEPNRAVEPTMHCQ